LHSGAGLGPAKVLWQPVLWEKYGAEEKWDSSAQFGEGIRHKGHQEHKGRDRILTTDGHRFARIGTQQNQTKGTKPQPDAFGGTPALPIRKLRQAGPIAAYYFGLSAAVGGLGWMT
jgi:hypothetical protein